MYLFTILPPNAMALRLLRTPMISICWFHRRSHPSGCLGCLSSLSTFGLCTGNSLRCLQSSRFGYLDQTRSNQPDLFGRFGYLDHNRGHQPDLLGEQALDLSSLVAVNPDIAEGPSDCNNLILNLGGLFTPAVLTSSPILNGSSSLPFSSTPRISKPPLLPVALFTPAV
jgi:hypothetical protein